MARHKGIPARARVGYAGYFRSGWWVDHVIAELWDASSERWRRVEPEISDEFASRQGLDPLDLRSDRFLTGPAAWRAARAGTIDPEKFLVAPELVIPYTRGWLSLRHHVVQDLAALNKTEMLLWDQWGVLDHEDPLSDAAELDRLASALDQAAPSVRSIVEWSGRAGWQVPAQVTSYSPAAEGAVTVDVSASLRRALAPPSDS